MKNNTRKGFTITELIIVIAVIAILAAVLIPTFSSIINKANESADLQAARNLMVEYVAQEDADVDGDYYIKIEKGETDVYFHVTNGQLSKTPEANTPSTGKYIEKTGSGEAAKIVLYEFAPAQTTPAQTASN